MEEGHRNEATFNMAIATLARLDGILKRMELVSEMTNGLTEQKLQIKLLRHFFLNATPLMNLVMKPTEYEKYKKQVFGLKLRSKIMKGKNYEYFSSDLENKILELVMMIQIEIKEYFMPPKGDDDDDDY